MDVPWWISHDNVELTENFEIEESQIAVDPLCVKHSFFRDDFFLGSFRLLVFFNVMNEFAIRIVASIEMRTVSETFICFLIDDRSEVFFGAH